MLIGLQSGLRCCLHGSRVVQPARWSRARGKQPFGARTIALRSFHGNLCLRFGKLQRRKIGRGAGGRNNACHFCSLGHRSPDEESFLHDQPPGNRRDDVCFPSGADHCFGSYA